MISTAPFRDMVLSLDELDSGIKSLAQNLKFRNTILVYVEVDCENHIKFNGGKSEVFCDDLRGFQARNKGVTKKVTTEIDKLCKLDKRFALWQK